MDNSVGMRRSGEVPFGRRSCGFAGMIAVMAAGAIACAPVKPADSSVVRSDSAGVRIVTSSAEDRDLPWRFEQVTLMRDTLGEPWLFEVLPAAYVLADRGGRSYVLLRERMIVRFAPDGSFDRTFGRKGGAPGEMELPLSLGSQGDTLYVLDPLRDALVRWGPDLAPINDLKLEGALDEASSIAFRSGGLWMLRHDFTPDSSILSLVGDTLGSAPLHRIKQPPTSVLQMCSGMIRIPPFFSPEIQWNAQGPRILVNSEPAYTLWLHEGSRVVASVRRTIANRAPTGADADRAMPNGFRVNFGGATTCEISAAEALGKVGAAPLLPHVDDLILMRDGSIWVQRHPLTGDDLTLDAFAPDGAYAGTVRGMRMPVAGFANGDLLVPVEDTLSGGFHLARMKVTR